MRVVLLTVAFLVLAAPTALAQPPAVAGVAEQAHVTLSETPGKVWVQWALVGPDPPANDPPFVLWRLGSEALQSTPGKAVGRLTATGTGVPGSVSVPTTIYAAEVGPIPAGATMSYQVGFAARGYTVVKTMRMVPAEDQPLRFLAYGDIGVDDTAADGSRTPNRPDYPAFGIRDLALTYNPDLLIIPGDLAYSNTVTGWNSFMRFMEPLQSRVITMPVMGNHEYDATAAYGQFLAEYVLPGDEHNYAFQAGPVTFIGVNSDTICTIPNRAQAGNPPRPCGSGDGLELNLATTNWLEAALAEAQNDSTPWTIVYFHHPSLSWGRHGITWSVHSYWSPLFEKYGVDLVVQAHDHLFGRTFPTVGRTPVVTGTNEFTKGTAPIYLVLGGGGRDLYQIPTDEPPAWYAVGQSVHHLGKFEVNTTSLRFEAIRLDKTLLDSFSITQAPGGPGTEPTAGTPGVAGTALLAVLALAIVWIRGRRR